MQNILVTAAASNADGSVSTGLGIFLVVILSLAALAVLGFIIAAIVSVLTSDVLAAGGKAVWVLLIFAFPILGAALWFLWGRTGQFTKDSAAPQAR